MILELKSVKKKYDKFELDCTLNVKSGCVTGLIGRNGAGKSTTFKAILNLIKIDGGVVNIDNTAPGEITRQKREEIGVVLSDSCFSGYLTVADIVPIMSAMYSKFDKMEFIKRCEDFAIPFNKKIKDFSTGMKAKLKVLIAMSYKAHLLILDEPTAGLDVVARDQILDMLRVYMEDENNSILISSHISSDLEGLCDDIYMIEDGKIILHEDTDILLDEYGILKLDAEQYGKLDKSYILCTKEEKYGIKCLTAQKQYYIENYPEIVVEKSSIDEVIMLMISDKKLKQSDKAEGK